MPSFFNCLLINFIKILDKLIKICYIIYKEKTLKILKMLCLIYVAFQQRGDYKNE